jgi:S-(hydroxymethyl)glutathione dehydrogenase/alcohol dehydrogenase
MKTRAAVAWKAGAPLTIETVDLEGPKAGEVLVEVKATGICHTDWFTLSGDDPEGLFPAILGHEGAGIVREVGAGVTHARRRRPRDPALHARVPAVQVLPVAEDQPLPEDPRDAGQGPDARRHEPLLDRRQAVLHYMGTSTFANHIVVPEIALAKIRPTRRSTSSATSAAASPPASARCSSPPRSRPAPTSSCSASAGSAST